MEASKRAGYVQRIHEKTKEAIEKMGKNMAEKRNQRRKEVLLEPGDLVWVHFPKDHFPHLQRSNLLPRGAGPYKVLSKINDNAYTIDLPTDKFGVSNSFSVANLIPYAGEDLATSRSTLFEGREMMRTSLHLFHLHLLMMIKPLLQRRTSLMISGLDLSRELVLSY
jgi:hypothetical protein